MPSETDIDPFHTQKIIRRLLDEAGLAPRKRFGQHFLVDRNLMNRLVQAAEIKPSDVLLEIGAGTGSLTRLLAATGARVITVEIDKSLVPLAGRTIADCPNVTLLQLDALAGKSKISPELISALRDALAGANARLKLVANLPYDIATPFVIDLLLTDLPLARLCFTVQSEVADRFLARPDSSDYGPVGIITQALCRGERIAKAPPQAFWPAPNVASAMVRLDPLPAGECSVANPDEFARFVRGFFLHRRKTLGHLARDHAKAGFILSALAALGIDPISRPETLGVSQWIDLFHAVE